MVTIYFTVRVPGVWAWLGRGRMRIVASKEGDGERIRGEE